MPWLQAHLTVDKTQAPLIELLFENLGALSITLEDAGDEPMLEPAPGATPLWQATKVTGLFSADTDMDYLRNSLNQSLNTDISRHLQLEALADEDWQRAWLARFQAMRFGQRLWICPTGGTIQQDDAVIVDLDPGLAFGTGTHPTTRLCLNWLDSADIAGKTVIDFGCGSGILAIAALKLGASKAIGIDHDPQAILASRENAKRNGVAGRFQALLNTDPLPAAADIVLANILANILVGLNTTISSLVKPGGDLVLSGILQNQADSVIFAYHQMYPNICTQNDSDWILVHAKG
jgi:ribosomal protein L11 methyltransferase